MIATSINTPEYWNMEWDRRLFQFHSVFAVISATCPPGSNVLDLGCGSGLLMSLLSIYKECSCVGIDLSQSAADRFNDKVNNCRIIPCSIEFAPEILDREFFDVVMMVEVLEHLEEPKKALKIAHSLLKEGGVGYFSVPDDCLGPEDEPEHLRKYTPLEFRDLVRSVFPKSGSGKMVSVDHRILAEVHK